MVNTNTKEFRNKIQAHIRNYMKGMGGTTGLFKDIQYLMSGRSFQICRLRI